MYFSERRALMLCPLCQRTDTVYIDARVESRQRRYLATAISLACPTCHAPMIEVDDRLTETLKKIHQHYIRTNAHCAKIHDHGQVDWVYRNSAKCWQGPYIIFKNLRPSVELILREVVDATVIPDDCIVRYVDSSDVIDTDTYPPRLAVDITKKSSSTMNHALLTLEKIVDNWLIELDNRGICYKEDRIHLYDMMLDNYIDPNPYWAHRSPFKLPKPFPDTK